MNTGLPLSTLGLGAAALGGEYGPIDTAVAHATVRTALDEGITLIDVSPYYGRTAAETVLGDALRGVRRATRRRVRSRRRSGRSTARRR